MAGFLVVAQQERRAVVLGQHYVQIAVPVEIEVGTAPADDRLEQVRAARRGGHRLEDFTGVPEQLCGLFVGLVRLQLGDVRVDVAVGREDVEPAVEVVVEEEGAELERPLARPFEAGRAGLVGEQEALLVDEHQEGVRLVGEVGDEHRLLARLVLADIDPHCPARGRQSVGDVRLHSLLLEPPPALAVGDVVEQEVPHGVVGHEQVRPAVAVGVEQDHAERLADRPLLGVRVRPLGLGHPDARRLAHVFKGAVALVAVQAALVAFERGRLLVGAADAGERRFDAQVDRGGPGAVVADEQVEFAVAVVIDEGGRGAERDRRSVFEERLARFAARPDARSGHAGLRRHVLEPLPADVAEQPVSADAGDEQVREAVVVEVADARPDAVHRDVQPGRHGHVRKRAVAVVAVQGEARGLVRHRSAGPRATVDE